MNILFSCGDFFPNLGGAVSLTDDLARAFLREGHAVTVVTRRQAGSFRLEKIHGYDVIRLAYPVPYEWFEWRREVILRSPGVLARIAAILIRRHIETVCIGLLDMSALYFLALRPLLRFRLVVYLHGGETRKLPAAQRSFRKLLEMSLRAADGVIAVSEDLAREAAQFCPNVAAKVRVIPNAIDWNHIAKAEKFEHAREFIAFVGRLTPEKDVATLVRAYGAVQEELGAVDLVIAGTGREEQKLREIAGACPHPERVIFLGEVSRARALSVMKSGMFVALPSVTEGLPIVAVEALALGKAVIASRIGGIMAVVREGEHGAFFAPGDSEALSLLLKKYCSDREALGKLEAAIRNSDLRRYDMGRVAREHLEMYRGGSQDFALACEGRAL